MLVRLEDSFCQENNIQHEMIKLKEFWGNSTFESDRREQNMTSMKEIARRNSISLRPGSKCRSTVF